MGAASLPSEISDYVTQAQTLETTRQKLVGKILDVAKAQVVPELAPLLPTGYSFDADGTEVHSLGGEPSSDPDERSCAEEEIPTGFGMGLRLLYGGKPISPHGQGLRKVMQIHLNLLPKLEELAQKHGVSYIRPEVEAIQMR